MSLKSFWEEEKQARKQRKLEKKLRKKSPLTGEQKFVKIAGIIVGILVAFGACFYSCSAFAGDYDWADFIGITDEMIAELEKPVDENLLFANGRIIKDDYDSYKIKLVDAGADVFESDADELYATKSFALTDKEVGALVNSLLAESGTETNMNVLDFEIFYENEYFYEKSIVSIDLNEVVEGENLPKVYLTSTSKVEVLNGQICVLSTSLQINAIEENINKEIVELLQKYNNFNLVSASNTTINLIISLFAENNNTKISLKDNCIEFNI